MVLPRPVARQRIRDDVGAVDLLLSWLAMRGRDSAKQVLASSSHRSEVERRFELHLGKACGGRHGDGELVRLEVEAEPLGDGVDDGARPGDAMRRVEQELLVAIGRALDGLRDDILGSFL